MLLWGKEEQFIVSPLGSENTSCPSAGLSLLPSGTFAANAPAGWALEPRGLAWGGLWWAGRRRSGFSLHLPASVPVMGLKGPDWDEQRWEWAMARLSACITNTCQVPRFKNNQKKLPTDIGVAKEYSSFLLSFQETFKTYRWVFLTTECYRYFRSGLLLAWPLALPCLIRTNCCK